MVLTPNLKVPTGPQPVSCSVTQRAPISAVDSQTNSWMSSRPQANWCLLDGNYSKSPFEEGPPDTHVIQCGSQHVCIVAAFYKYGSTRAVYSTAQALSSTSLSFGCMYFPHLKGPL